MNKELCKKIAELWVHNGGTGYEFGRDYRAIQRIIFEIINEQDRLIKIHEYTLESLRPARIIEKKEVNNEIKQSPDP